MRQLVEIVFKVLGIYFFLTAIPDLVSFTFGYFGENSGFGVYLNFYLAGSLTQVIVFGILFFGSRQLAKIVVREDMEPAFRLKTSALYICSGLFLIGMTIPLFVESINRPGIEYKQEIIYFLGYGGVVVMSLFLIKRGRHLAQGEK